jgi:hypothetical protein
MTIASAHDQLPNDVPSPGAFELAIVGGCMSHQTGIPFNSLYHRQLAREAKRLTGIRLRPHVARGFGLDFGARLDTLQERVELDGVLLHLRVMVAKRARLIVRGRASEGRRARVHPALLSRGHDGPAIDELREAENDGDDVEERTEVHAANHERRWGWRGGITSLELNTALGAMVGLDRWAADDEVHRLAYFATECDKRRLPLFILGPTRLVGARWAARPLRGLDRRIAEFAKRRDLPFALVDALNDRAGRPLFKRDGVHLTLEGHTFVAGQLIAGGFIEWMRSHARIPAEATD